MKKVTFCLIILLLIAYSYAKDEGLIKAVKEEVNKISASFPSGYQNNIKNIQGTTSVVTDTLKITEIDIIKQKYELPDKVADLMKAIAFSQSTSIKSFDYLFNDNTSKMREFVGALYKSGNVVHFAYIKTEVSGSLLPKYENVSYQDCWWFLFFKFCKTKYRNIQRGYNLAEINVVKAALRAQAYQNINNKIHFFKDDTQLVLTDNQEITSLSNGKKLMIISSTGQLFVGKSSFNDKYLNQVKRYGKLLGPPQNPSKGPFSLVLRNDGNLALVNKLGEVTWTAFTGHRGNAPFRLSVTEEGELYLSDSQWKPLYDSKNWLQKKQFALLQEYRYYSNNGKYYVQVQREGDIILYEQKNGAEKDKIVWNTNEFHTKTGPFILVIEASGNLKVIDKEGKKVWETGKTTKIPGPYSLRVTDDGVLQVLNGRKGIIWSSK